MAKTPKIRRRGNVFVDSNGRVLGRNLEGARATLAARRGASPRTRQGDGSTLEGRPAQGPGGPRYGPGGVPTSQPIPGLTTTGKPRRPHRQRSPRTGKPVAGPPTRQGNYPAANPNPVVLPTTKKKKKTTDPAAATTPRRTSGGRTTTTRTTTTRTTGGGGGGGGGGRGGSGGGGGGSTASTAPPTTTVPDTGVEQDVAKLYNPAMRAIARQRDSLGLQNEQRLKSQQNFENWLAQKQGEGAQWLREMQANNQTAAAQAGQAAADKINTTLTSIRGMLGNSAADTLAGNGGVAAAENAATNAQDVMTRANAGAASVGSNLAVFNANQGLDAARMANLRSVINAEYNRGLADLGNQETTLRTNFAKAVQEGKQQQIQNQLDREAADFMNQYRQGQLAVDQQNADTRAVQAQVDAKYKAERLRIDEAYRAGQLTLRERELQLKAAQAQLRARQKARGKNAGAQRQATDALGTWLTNQLKNYGGGAIPGQTASYESLNAADQGQLIHKGIAFLKARHPKLRQAQVLQILNGTYGGRLNVHVLNGQVVPPNTPGAQVKLDPRIYRDVVSRFPK